MTDLKEYSDDILAIDYRKSWIIRILHLAGGVSMLVFAVCLFLQRGDVTPIKGREAFAAPFLILLEIGFALGAFFLVSGVFDRISYDFDKRADVFQISGRRYLFKKIKAVGAVSEILTVSCEIYGRDDETSSEIFFKYRCFGSGTETVKCGSGDQAEDVLIVDCIERFLKLATKN